MFLPGVSRTGVEEDNLPWLQQQRGAGEGRPGGVMPVVTHAGSMEGRPDGERGWRSRGPADLPQRVKDPHAQARPSEGAWARELARSFSAWQWVAGIECPAW